MTWTEEMANESITKQHDVMHHALRIFRERNEKYKDLWKQYTPEDHALHIKSKAMRTIQSVTTGEPPEVIEEDAMDLINYAVFLIRSVRGERSSGDGS